jgi:hypothetical protein
MLLNLFALSSLRMTFILDSIIISVYQIQSLMFDMSPSLPLEIIHGDAKVGY